MIRSIIIDSESVDNIKKLLGKYNDIEIVDIFSNPFESLHSLVSKDINLVFIEPNIPDFNGFEFIRNLSSDIHVVITSSVKEYAIEAFELDVLDYLIKPISQKRFLNTITRIYKAIASNLEGHNPERTSMYVKVDKKMIKIYHDQILYIEAIGDYIKIVCKTENFVTKSTLKKFTEELPSEDFLRVHRSYTISSKRVTAIDGNTIEIGEATIPIGRQYTNIVKDKIIH